MSTQYRTYRSDLGSGQYQRKTVYADEISEWAIPTQYNGSETIGMMTLPVYRNDALSRSAVPPEYRRDTKGKMAIPMQHRNEAISKRALSTQYRRLYRQK